MNSECHYMVVISVAKCSDHHYVLPQIIFTLYNYRVWIFAKYLTCFSKQNISSFFPYLLNAFFSKLYLDAIGPFSYAYSQLCMAYKFESEFKNAQVAMQVVRLKLILHSWNLLQVGRFLHLSPAIYTQFGYCASVVLVIIHVWCKFIIM